MGLFNVSLDKESKELIREVIDLIKSLKNQEVVTYLRDKIGQTSVSSTFGPASSNEAEELRRIK